MGKKIYVYEGFCNECFITDKRVNEDWIVCCSSVTLAESFVDAVGGVPYLDRDLISESQYSWVGDDYDFNTMTAKDWFNF